jgi:hypothetical protein
MGSLLKSTVGHKNLGESKHRTGGRNSTCSRELGEPRSSSEIMKMGSVQGKKDVILSVKV